MVPVKPLNAHLCGLFMACILISGIGDRIAVAEEPKGIFPDQTSTGFVVRYDQLPPAMRKSPPLFAPDAEGRPTLLTGTRLARLAITNKQQFEAIRLPDPGQDIEHFAWMRDGAMLAIAGKRLIVPGENGFQTILKLPEKGMRMVPADAETLYIYGGTSRAQRLSVYLYRKDGALAELARLPYPVTAVAGNGDVHFVAVGRSILIISPGEPVSLVYRPRSEVRSLAFAPPYGLFFATRDSVGFIHAAGKGFKFLAVRNAQVHVGGDHLYIVIPDEGVLRSSPVNEFKKLADRIGQGP